MCVFVCVCVFESLCSNTCLCWICKRLGLVLVRHAKRLLLLFCMFASMYPPLPLFLCLFLICFFFFFYQASTSGSNFLKTIRHPVSLSSFNSSLKTHVFINRNPVCVLSKSIVAVCGCVSGIRWPWMALWSPDLIQMACCQCKLPVDVFDWLTFMHAWCLVLL